MGVDSIRARVSATDQEKALAFTVDHAKLMRAAWDRAGKPIYLEMSSINPVVILEGALRERAEAIADGLFASCTTGAGQFCTKPGLVILPEGELGQQFIEAARRKFEAAAPGVLAQG